MMVKDLLEKMGIIPADPTSPYLSVEMVIQDADSDPRVNFRIDAIVPDGLYRVYLHIGDKTA